MKIIAIIEDTGERRKPLPGEPYTHDHSVRDADVCRYIYTHESTGATEYAILRVTESDDLDQPLCLKERIELIHLRRFHKAVREASFSHGGSLLDTDQDALLKEADQLGTRLMAAGIVLRESMKELQIREQSFTKVSPCPADWPNPSEEIPTPDQLAHHAVNMQGTARAAANLPEVIVVNPFETEETPF